MLYCIGILYISFKTCLFVSFLIGLFPYYVHLQHPSKQLLFVLCLAPITHSSVCLIALTILGILWDLLKRLDT